MNLTDLQEVNSLSNKLVSYEKVCFSLQVGQEFLLKRETTTSEQGCFVYLTLTVEDVQVLSSILAKRMQTASAALTGLGVVF